MSEKSAPKRQYTDEFKIEAVRLAESVGQHEAARRLGIPVATLGNWTRCSLLSNSAGKADGHEALATRATRPISKLEAENIPGAYNYRDIIPSLRQRFLSIFLFNLETEIPPCSNTLAFAFC